MYVVTQAKLEVTVCDGGSSSFIFQNLLNFTYSLKLPPDKQWGSKMANGSWTGIIGELLHQRADICKFQ